MNYELWMREYKQPFFHRLFLDPAHQHHQRSVNINPWGRIFISIMQIIFLRTLQTELTCARFEIFYHGRSFTI